MPTYAVHIKVAGPLKDVSDGARFDGAYSHLFVSANDEGTAQQLALDKLSGEHRFSQLRSLDGFCTPYTEVDEVRQVRWYEALMGTKALVLYRGPRDVD